MKENKNIFIDNINHTFYFVNISDVSDLILSIVGKKKSNKHSIYSVNGNKTIKLLKLVKYLKKNLKSKSKIKIIKKAKSVNNKVKKIVFSDYKKNFYKEILKIYN